MDEPCKPALWSLVALPKGKFESGGLESAASSGILTAGWVGSQPSVHTLPLCVMQTSFSHQSSRRKESQVFLSERGP